MNVNDNKDGIHQTESVINMDTRVNTKSKWDIRKPNDVNNNKDGIH